MTITTSPVWCVIGTATIDPYEFGVVGLSIHPSVPSAGLDDVGERLTTIFETGPLPLSEFEMLASNTRAHPMNTTESPTPTSDRATSTITVAAQPAGTEPLEFQAVREDHPTTWEAALDADATVTDGGRPDLVREFRYMFVPSDNPILVGDVVDIEKLPIGEDIVSTGLVDGLEEFVRFLQVSALAAIHKMCYTNP